VDPGTENVLLALDPVGVELLSLLLATSMTEAEILNATSSLEQSTCNRHLHRLRAAGLVTHETGRSRAPGRRWSVRDPEHTELLLLALFSLADSVEEANRASRAAERRQLKLRRAKRLGIESMPARVERRTQHDR
jgi:predicted transcriptional regulator